MSCCFTRWTLQHRFVGSYTHTFSIILILPFCPEPFSSEKGVHRGIKYIHCFYASFPRPLPTHMPRPVPPGPHHVPQAVRHCHRTPLREVRRKVRDLRLLCEARSRPFSFGFIRWRGSVGDRRWRRSARAHAMAHVMVCLKLYAMVCHGTFAVSDERALIDVEQPLI